MIDMYDGTEGLSFRHNDIVSARGFATIIANKTSKETNFDQDTIVENNIIRNDGLMMKFQGSFSMYEYQDSNDEYQPKGSSGFQNLVLHNNLFECVGCSSSQSVTDIRFFHDVDITQNDFKFTNSHSGAAVSLASNEDVLFSGNDVWRGGLKLSKSTSNSNANHFRGYTRKVVVTNNTFRNGRVSGGEVINLTSVHDSGSSNKSAVTINNNVLTQVSSGSMDAAIGVSSSKILTLTVRNNVVNLQSSADEILLCSGGTPTTVTLSGNTNLANHCK